MGKVNTGKESNKKQKENNKNAPHLCGGKITEQTFYTNKTEKWTGKDGYTWVQSGKIMAPVHPKLEIFKKKWKCSKCSAGLKSVTVSLFDIYFGGGESGKYVEKFKASCICGWKNEVEDTTFGPDPHASVSGEKKPEETSDEVVEETE